MRLAVCLIIPAAILSLSPDLKAVEDDLAAKAQAVLTAHCHRCHGQEGTSKGGFGYLRDRERLVALGKILPGKPGESELFRRLESGEMPPASVKQRPGAEEVAVVRRWIEAGARAVSPPTGPRPFLSEGDVGRLILADIQTIESRQRRFIRYLSLTHLGNSGVSDADLDAARAGVAKLVNSLSWHPRLTVPAGIDPLRTLLRIDLRDYQWTPRLWDRLATVYPYTLDRESPEARAISAATGAEVPYLRADWFCATVSQPPFYHDFLQLPASDRELERLLRVDVLANLRDDTALRAGFNGSGVSRNNRLIERHDAAYGGYWRSYDFSDNVDRQNLFERPLGPQAREHSFVHAGGELLFHLPNGLQAYLLVDANGRRIDRAPIEIVSDPRRPDRTVTTGLSCFTCHVRGLIPKADQVRAHVQKNAAGFSPDAAAAIRSLYVPEAVMRQRLNEDVDRFVKSLRAVGVSPDDPEPIAALVERFESPLSLAAAAAEMGLPVAELETRLRRLSPPLTVLGPLLTRGGTVQRSAFEAAFPEILRVLRPEKEPRNAATTSLPPVTPGLRPFTGHTGSITCVVISADGRHALSGSEDRTVRLWEMNTGREKLRLEGPTEEVLCVALSPDSRRAVAGSKDGTLRLWDLDSGKAVSTLKGHLDRVTAVAFTSDGKRVLSGSWDQTLRLWDAATAEELTQLRQGGKVLCVALGGDGRSALSGSSDGTLHQWDLRAGRELRRLHGHTRDVFTVALSADGQTALSGGADRTVRMWDLSSGKLLKTFTGHETPVIGVSFSDEGRRIVAVASQYRTAGQPWRVWDVESERELRAFGVAGETVWSAGIASGGNRALTASSDRTLRLWRWTPEP